MKADLLKSVIIPVLIFVSSGSHAGTRTVYTINESWEFSKEAAGPDDDCSWSVVDIPHTWNAGDAMDDEPGMYRGGAWYRKAVRIPAEAEGRRTVIYFEGANQEASLYVNGRHVGDHVGGYTRFCFDITDYIEPGVPNSFAVHVTNKYNPDIPPLSADFTFFGGIYRDVLLMSLPPVHISTDDYASSGVYIRTPEVSGDAASVEVTALVSNGSGKPADLMVEYEIRDVGSLSVVSDMRRVRIPVGETSECVSGLLRVPEPHLWDIDDPYMYRIYTRIYDRKTGCLLDEVAEPLGLRWYSFDPEKGFFLNGKHRKLTGTARHQDFLGIGNALRDEYHVQDVLLLKKMGGNFLRVSHYPQDPAVMDMCDKLGIVTSVEIPVINAVTESESFLDNAVAMAVEMVRQDFNRPSVMIWGYMNEILLRQPYPDGDTVDLPRYYEFTRKVAQALEDTIRAEDPSRYTMMACHNAPFRYEAAGLTEIPMILAWNLYQGWYEPDIDEFQRLLDRAHDVYKGKSLIVSEYGPGVDVRVHSYSPERFDFSQEYGLLLHRHYIREISARPFIAGSSIWNLNDFYSEPRVDTNPHVNNKGLLGLDREKKDVYLFYSALLSDQPYLRIGNREWKARGGVSDTASGVCLQSVPVFSNASDVELRVNGKSLGIKPVKEACVFFDVPFADGENELEARVPGTGQCDRLVVDFQAVPEMLDGDFRQLNVMLGSLRYFDDRYADVAWIPEKEYVPGSWGYVGGTPYRRPTDFGTMPGSDLDILGTDQDPLFQTQRRGIESFRADVPDGQYSVYLYWSELDSDMEREALAYNLGADAVSSGESSARSFDLSINGLKVLDDFNIAEECGVARPVIRKFVVEVSDGAGLSVDFGSRQGETALNAIRIYRNY